MLTAYKHEAGSRGVIIFETWNPWYSSWYQKSTFLATIYNSYEFDFITYVDNSGT